MAMDNGLGRAVVKLFNFWSRVSTKYNLLKHDEEKRDKSAYLGWQGIINTLVGVVIVALCCLGVKALWGNFSGGGQMPIFSIIGVIVLGIGAVMSFAQNTLCAVIFVGYQLKLNKQPIGWVALLLWFVGIGAQILSVWLILLK